MLTSLRQYGALIGAFFLVAVFIFISVFSYRKGAEKWKERAQSQKARADAILQERKNAKEAKEIATEYEHEQTQQSDEDIENDGYTSTLDDDINNYP